MAAEVQTNEPEHLTLGTTWKWKKTLADYLASAGWTLKYYFRKTSALGFSITASASGDDHLVTHAPASQSAYTAGRYEWTARVENAGGEKYVVERGFIEILPDPSASVEGRSLNRQILDALEAVFLSGFTSDVQDYEITTPGGSRKLSKMNKVELLSALRFFRRRVANEEKRRRAAAGEDVGTTVLVRLTRP